ncbi:PepSY domain-containing protein [Salinicoccus sp. RF5]|uniref:PepSY domain-containing protein n=1 Tax=Salinicoccus sp. RF5 TaxID=2748874 RepID=UPI001E45E222|nr:PepSY domain-containing protein [Salinicoccus sp. RF5]MCC4723717.1 PepSY domain-containing protein [Salinicoccus sp. RF5]
MEKRYKLASALLSASLVMAACGGADENPDSSEVDEVVEENEEFASTEESTEESSGQSSGSTGDTIAPEDINHDAEEAVNAASENFDGELVEVELDNEDGQWLYKVDMESESEEYEAKLSVDDLSVVEEQTESDDDFDTDEHFSYGDAVPAEEAVQTAMDETNGELEGWTLDKDDDQLQYEVDMKNGDNEDSDVTINAENGEIVETDD